MLWCNNYSAIFFRTRVTSKFNMYSYVQWHSSEFPSVVTILGHWCCYCFAWWTADVFIKGFQRNTQYLQLSNGVDIVSAEFRLSLLNILNDKFNYTNMLCDYSAVQCSLTLSYYLFYYTFICPNMFTIHPFFSIFHGLD